MAHWFIPLSRWFGVIGAGLALLTGFMTFTSVFMRAFLQTPIPGDVELTQMGIALAISMCLPWCQTQRGHILVDFFTQKSSAQSLRKNQLLVWLHLWLHSVSQPPSP